MGTWLLTGSRVVEGTTPAQTNGPGRLSEIWPWVPEAKPIGGDGDDDDDGGDGDGDDEAQRRFSDLRFRASCRRRSARFTPPPASESPSEAAFSSSALSDARLGGREVRGAAVEFDAVVEVVEVVEVVDVTAPLTRPATLAFAPRA